MVFRDTGLTAKSHFLVFHSLLLTFYADDTVMYCSFSSVVYQCLKLVVLLLSHLKVIFLNIATSVADSLALTLNER